MKEIRKKIFQYNLVIFFYNIFIMSIVDMSLKFFSIPYIDMKFVNFNYYFFKIQTNFWEEDLNSNFLRYLLFN